MIHLIFIINKFKLRPAERYLNRAHVWPREEKVPQVTAKNTCKSGQNKSLYP